MEHVVDFPSSEAWKSPEHNPSALEPSRAGTGWFCHISLTRLLLRTSLKVLRAPAAGAAAAAPQQPPRGDCAGAGCPWWSLAPSCFQTLLSASCRSECCVLPESASRNGKGNHVLSGHTEELKAQSRLQTSTCVRKAFTHRKSLHGTRAWKSFAK